MSTNVERFKKDLAALVTQGTRLHLAMDYERDPAEFAATFKAKHNNDVASFVKLLPSFRKEYQSWYTEALAVVRQLIPARVDDFIRHYEKPKGRKGLDTESYRIEDYLQGLSATRGFDDSVVVDTTAAIPHFAQQLAILKAASARFESSLFEIRQLVQADLLDSEIEAAEVLNKHKFHRAAGALAGVVLERHLAQVCVNHNVSVKNKNPTMSTLNDALKEADVIEVTVWRFIQHLADIRNNCDHSRAKDPTKDEIIDLIAGVKRVIKTVV